jgi:two-component system nitrate/nitrite response regulator NarL
VELNLVAEAVSGREALDAIREHRPQVAVVDLKMSEPDGLAILRTVKREGLETKIVVLTGYAEAAIAHEAMAAGASAYVSKASEPKALCETIAVVARGDICLAPEFQGTLDDQDALRAKESGPALSAREQEVLSMAADGESVAQIGVHVNLSPSTIKSHFEHAYEKLGVSDRAAAVAEAMRRGVVE